MRLKRLILTTILTLACIFCTARFWATEPPSLLNLGRTCVTAAKSFRIAWTIVSMSKFKWYLQPYIVSITLSAVSSTETMTPLHAPGLKRQLLYKRRCFSAHTNINGLYPGGEILTSQYFQRGRVLCFECLRNCSSPFPCKLKRRDFQQRPVGFEDAIDYHQPHRRSEANL
jgi:hypothetical protein